MITSTIPRTWRHLQTQSACVLRECGFEVEVEKLIESARGKAEIDVYAEENVHGRRYSTLCECKYWKRKVPQSVVHAFRNVVSDIGANLGLIIATKGFQSGANQAATFTNVRLVTWLEFQEEFEMTWISRHLLPALNGRCDALLTYLEPLPPRWLSTLSEPEAEAFLELREKYGAFGWLLVQFSPFLHDGGRPIPRLPLRPVVEAFAPDHGVPSDVLDAIGYREFFEAAVAHADAATAEFGELRRSN